MQGFTVAAKVFDLEFLPSDAVDQIRREVLLLNSLDHPHIVRVRETFDWQHQIFVVMELCSGGDLYSRDPYTEVQAVRIVHKILSAVAYMHSKEV